MARKKQQQARIRQRKAAKRKQLARRKASAGGPPAGRMTWLKRAGSWPVHEVLVSETWRDPKHVAMVVVARRSTGGTVAAASFLMDLACLGAKNAFIAVFHSEAEYSAGFRREYINQQSMVAVDLDLAARIVQEGVRYGRANGIRPSPDYQRARLLLEGAEPDRCDTEIPLGGPDGKPLYVAGPHDDARRIMDRLRDRLGPDGFHFIVPHEVLGDEL